MSSSLMPMHVVAAHEDVSELDEVATTDCGGYWRNSLRCAVVELLECILTSVILMR